MPRRKKVFGPVRYPECGTYAGYQIHKKQGNNECEPCNAARNQYMRDYRHRRGDNSGTWVYVPDPTPLTADHYCI